MPAEPAASTEPPAITAQRTAWPRRPRPPLVENVDGQPVILWRRVLAASALVLTSIGSGQLLIAFLTRGPLNSFAVAAPLCMYLIVLVVLIERERNAILLGSSGWRIGLAGMLIVITLISIVLGTFVAERQRSLRRFADQQALRQTISELPGVVQATVNDDGITCQVTSKTFSDADLRQLAELAHLPGHQECILSHLFLSGTAITDAGLAALADCQSLTLLDVSGTAITDTSLAHLSNCRGLSMLLATKTQITTAGLAALRGLPKLERVYISGTTAATDPACDTALPGVEIIKQ